MSTSNVSSHINSTNATNRTSHPTITNAQETKVLEALTILHSVVAARGPNVLPLDLSNYENIQYIVSRTLTAVSEKAAERHADLLALSSAKIADVIQAARDEGAVLVAEFNDMSEKLRSKLKATCPTHAEVAYTSFVACFPEGTKDAYITKTLAEMKLVVVAPKGADRYVKVAFAV